MKRVLLLLVVLAFQSMSAQNYAEIVEQYMDQNRSQWGFTSEDVQDLQLSSSSFSKSMNVQNVYLNQAHNGIEVFNSTSTFALKNGQVVMAKSNFVRDLASKVNTTSASITPSQAIVQAAQQLGQNMPTNLQLLEENGNSYLFTNGGVSLTDIPVKLVYQPIDNGTVRLAWDLNIYLLDASHWYSVRIDAVNGTLLDTMDWVAHCDFGVGNHSHKVEESILFLEESATMMGGASYRVFPMPYSSPIDGADEIVVSPENLNASPLGWHDTDGVGGADFTITRGNNVWAQEDINGNNGVGASPDGGATLEFDFPYGLPQPPANFTDAATVNLFYWNNIIHDVAYEYGFDEESGNFQEFNYTGDGVGSDSVNADAQDGSGTNNANFATPPEGQNPRMQMFIWSGSTALVDILTINNGPLAGTYQGMPASFGGPLPVPPFTEDLVVVEDDPAGTADTNDGCDPITNGADLNGKIVVIRRGECEFGFKALAAQNEGAAAVIMVNNVPGDPIIMAPGANGGSVTIPLFMVSDVDGEAIISELLGGNTVNGTISGENVPPDIDGDLDNEIIVHEYGHGISNRLTGGAGTTGCLQNAEQMGEGWSDYFGLMLTMQAGDLPEDVRGLAAYASGNPNGIREAPYSTDFAINDYTYDDTNFNTTQPHGIGFVWATMLWEMTWDLIDIYGFDPDFYNGTGGNNISMQLVMDGMKLQACSPGFIDGRDAILMADELANGGEHKCLIWEAFARRGLGFSASQGSSSSRTDQVEAFDLPAECNLATSDFDYDRNFEIYPNPTNGTINIASKVALGTTEVSVIDMNGRTVMQQTLEIGNHASMDASALSAGIYLVKIDGGNYVHTAKLIKR